MISSTDNKQVKKVIKLLEKGKTRREEDAFVVEGIRLFSETPAEDIISVFVSESLEASLSDSPLQRKLSDLFYEVVSDDVFKKMSDTVTDQGVLAIVKMRHYRLEDVVKEGGTYLLLEKLQDPGNLGTIMRTAEGAGVDAVIMSSDTVDIYNPKTVRATMGAIYREKFVYVEDLKVTVDYLKNHGIACFAAHLKAKESMWQQDYTNGTAFFIGNEGNGLTDVTASLADKFLIIPMEGGLESLNAAVSAALLSYEAKRQRTFKNITRAVLGIPLLVAGLLFTKEKAYADTVSDVLGRESVGATVVFDVKAYNGESTENLGIEIEEVVEEDTGSNLVMANVRSALNVRAKADLESDIVGKIYKDCGGKVLERGEEWSLIETGELVGYASNEYLLFDEEAEALARDVGFTNVLVKENAIFVKAENSPDSVNIGILSQNATAEIIDESDENWIKIAYGDGEGYVLREHVKITFTVDHGETMAAINERKRLEREAKLALIRQREAMQSDENIERLLAALIQCEAGGEPYEGMQAVGAVVMNRVRSGAYPSSVYDVIFASGQFTPAKTGSLHRVYNNGPREICFQAARDALGGYTNVGDMTHFRRKGTKEGVIIGNHVFY